MGDWKPGETCFIPATAEGLLWQGTDLNDGKLQGFVRCRVAGRTEASDDGYDLEDCRPSASPAGNAPWGNVPSQFMYAEVPKGCSELTE